MYLRILSIKPILFNSLVFMSVFEALFTYVIVNVSLDYLMYLTWFDELQIRL